MGIRYGSWMIGGMVNIWWIYNLIIVIYTKIIKLILVTNIIVVNIIIDRLIIDWMI